jgi:two-component system NtrC family sensor kinase
VDEETKSIRILISENPWYEYRGHAIPMDKGVAGVVAASGKPIVVEDYNNWENRINSDRPAPFWSVAAVPLKLQGATIGTLMLLEDRKEKRFRPEDIQLLEMLAPQIAVSIRNARLYQALQDQSEAQKLAEAQLVRSARLAAVGEMAAGVAHELNNPLTTIAGFTELMLEEIPVNSPQKEDLALVLQESQRARLVVRRLLDFSRHSESLKEISDINVIIQEVLAIVHHMARTGGVNIEFNTADDLPEIFIDRNQIKQVVINLVQNGIQAMPDGGKMEIQTKLRKRDEEGWVTIDIRDYGVGITKHNMDRIFEPFFTTKPVGSGTGLGLSISYGILAEHGGFMEIESEPGTGSLFRIWLPNRKNDL